MTSYSTSYRNLPILNISNVPVIIFYFVVIVQHINLKKVKKMVTCLNSIIIRVYISHVWLSPWSQFYEVGKSGKFRVIGFLSYSLRQFIKPAPDGYTLTLVAVR